MSDLIFLNVKCVWKLYYFFGTFAGLIRNIVIILTINTQFLFNEFIDCFLFVLWIKEVNVGPCVEGEAKFAPGQFPVGPNSLNDFQGVRSHQNKVG